MLKMGYHYSWLSLHEIIVVALKWMRYDPILKDNMLYNKWASDFSRVDKMKVDTNFHLGRHHLKNKLEREILQAEVGFSRHWQKLSSSIGSMFGSRWSGVIPTCSHMRVNSHIGAMDSKLLKLGRLETAGTQIKSTRWVISSNQQGVFQKKWDAMHLVNVCMSWSFITGNCDCHAWTVGQCKHRLYFPVNLEPLGLY